MSNAPKTPARAFRIPDDIWSDLQKLAKEKGVTVTAIVLDLIKQYVRDNKVVYGDWQ